MLAPAAAPQVLGDVADFRLLDQAGQPFGRSDMAGKVWIVDFIFTTCPMVCPQMTRALHELGRSWRHEPGLEFLSISVDAAHDTPEVLARYAAGYQPPIPRWTLLTGDPAAIRALCLESFRLAVGDTKDERGDITHSTRFVLVDDKGRIRGYYDSLDPGKMTELNRDVQALLARDNS